MAKEKFQKVKSAEGGQMGMRADDMPDVNGLIAIDFRPFPSVQAELFNYLRKEQQEYVRPVLRAFKKKMQEKLCVALLDYMETGKAEIPDNIQLGGAFLFLTRFGLPMEDDVTDRRIIRPFVVEGIQEIQGKQGIQGTNVMPVEKKL